MPRAAHRLEQRARGGWVRLQRKSRGQNQLDLAEAYSGGSTYVSEIETGSKIPSAELLSRLEQAWTLKHPESLLALVPTALDQVHPLGATKGRNPIELEDVDALVTVMRIEPRPENPLVRLVFLLLFLHAIDGLRPVQTEPTQSRSGAKGSGFQK